MTVRVGRINGKNLNYTDYDVSAGESAFLNAGIIEGMEVVSGFVNVGRAMVEVTRTNTVPYQKFLVHVEITTREPVDTTGNKKIWLEVNEQYINNGTLATDPRGVGIARVLTGENFPIKNSLPLAEIVNGQIVKKSTEISTKFLQKYVPSRTNLNDIKTPGFYYNSIVFEANTITNMPPSSEKTFGMIVYASSGVIQEWTNSQATEKWVRRFYNNSWGEWKKIFPFSATALDVAGLVRADWNTPHQNTAFLMNDPNTGQNNKVTLENLKKWIFNTGTSVQVVYSRSSNWTSQSFAVPKGGLAVASCSMGYNYSSIRIEYSDNNSNWQTIARNSAINNGVALVSAIVSTGFVRFVGEGGGYDAHYSGSVQVFQ